METQNNTGLGLIKSTIERVQNQKSLFTSALKKLVNSSEEEIGKYLGEVKKRVLKNLALMAEILIPEVKKFIVSDKFQHRAKDEMGIKTYLYDNFASWIINPMKGEKVSLAAPLKLEKFKLEKAMHDTEIQKELGNPGPIHITQFLPLLWTMLVKQANGEEGDLLVNGYANIFHVELENGPVVAVDAFWFAVDREWILDAYELDYVYGWDDGRCFFSPASA